MLNFKIILIFTINLFFLSMFSCLAQSRNNSKNLFLIGLNVVDDSFTSKNNFFNSKEEWNTVFYPSFFSYNRKVSNNLNLDLSFSLNHYNKGKLVDGNFIISNKKYSAFDFGLKYNLNTINNDVEFIPGIVPIVSFGFGLTSIDNKLRPTLNYGAGFYFWFSSLNSCDCKIYDHLLDNFGLLFQTHAKSSFEQKIYGNQIQHVFGLVYRK